MKQKCSDKVLFYMFYTLTFDKQQEEAARLLKSRGWKYNESNMRWYKKESATGLKVFDPL